MSIISRKTHGTLDYLVGAVLIASPWLFDFYTVGAQAIVPITLGLAAIIYSLVTNYEYGVVSLLPFSTHLILDLISGILLALSPWIFGFSETVFVPHLALGLAEIAVVLLTEKPRRLVPMQGKKANTPRAS